MMIVQSAERSGWLFAFLLLLFGTTRSAERTANPPVRAAPPVPAAAKAKTGTIAGTVFYQADPKRRWRQGRYYIADPAGGQLAEAVVALVGKDLGKSEAAARPATTVIDQKNFQFTPETVAIRAGDRVKFLNSDKELHNVNVFHKLHSFNVNMPPGGEHFERFEHANDIRRPYRLGCVYHGAMRGWIYVFDHPFYQLTRRDGRYRLENVPPGKYRLEMVHPAGQLRWSEVIEVTAGQVTRKDIRVSPDNSWNRR
jgi:plastocyanin